MQLNLIYNNKKLKYLLLFYVDITPTGKKNETSFQPINSVKWKHAFQMCFYIIVKKLVSFFFSVGVIRYTQINDTKVIKEIIELDYTIQLRNYLFGSITEQILTNYVNAIKSIPPGSVLDDVKRTYKSIKQSLQETHNMKINISPKVDSKSQRRVQCSIPKIDELIEHFPEIVLSRAKNAILRGIQLTSIIQSGTRKRNKKE